MWRRLNFVYYCSCILNSSSTWFCHFNIFQSETRIQLRGFRTTVSTYWLLLWSTFCVSNLRPCILSIRIRSCMWCCALHLILCLLFMKSCPSQKTAAAYNQWHKTYNFCNDLRTKPGPLDKVIHSPSVQLQTISWVDFFMKTEGRQKAWIQNNSSIVQ